jgi:hypothetical protein
MHLVFGMVMGLALGGFGLIDAFSHPPGQRLGASILCLAACIIWTLASVEYVQAALRGEKP